MKHTTAKDRTRKRMDAWTAGMVLVCLLTSIPILEVAAGFLAPTTDVWDHLVDTQLVTLIRNTLVLLVCVTFSAAALGVFAAWFVAAFEFPGRRLFEWALILPLAFPTYVLGYVLLDLFGISGPIQSLMRTQLGGVPAWFPNIRGTGGVAFVMVLAFFPYVYLLARTAFRTHGRMCLDAAKSLGHGPFRSFFRVVLPMARPWIFGGVLLVSMETLADFGTVSIFNYDTFTTGIYKAWYSFFSIETATRLASMLLFLALLLFGMEQLFQSKRRYYQGGHGDRTRKRARLKGLPAFGVTAVLSAVLFFAFVLPMGHLLFWTLKTLSRELTPHYGILVKNTIAVGLLAALLVGSVSLFLAYGVRLKPRPWLRGMVTVATMGYALPGTVLAVGVFLPLTRLDHGYASLHSWLFGSEPGLLLNGTLAAMLAAYTVRFLTVAHQSVTAALKRVRPSMEEAARSMGLGRLSVLWKVHLPLLRTGVVTAVLMVLIEVMKEMPMTLMTRPFGWDTLSVRIFELTSEGEYRRAALPSMLLVLTGLVPVALLTKLSERREMPS